MLALAASRSLPFFALADLVRRAQGRSLAACGLGPSETRYRVVAEGARWRLRRYRGARVGAAILIVSSPIKQPYIWDIAPEASPIRRAAERGLDVFLLEWKPPGTGGPGLAHYVGEDVPAALGAAAAAAGRPLVLMGHSLGGTFAAMAAALGAEPAAGLVLVGAPLCFHPGVSRFRDALVRSAPPVFALDDVVPGTLLTEVSAIAAPDAFLWSRWADVAWSLGDAAALRIHARIERWALDEFPLPGALLNEILAWLYGEDRFFLERLPLGDTIIGPSRLGVPLFAIANTADEIAPPESVAPFLEAMPPGEKEFVSYDGEVGVGMQHFALLAGRHALATLWPRIFAWIERRRHGAR